MALFDRSPDRLSRGALALGDGAASAPLSAGGRALRAQAVHRLQVGLFGLAGMLLLVSLANVVMDRAQQAQQDTVPSLVTPGATATANDPLVDMGVAPELPVAGGADDAGKSAPPASPRR